MDVYRGADKVAELGSYDELRVGANKPAFIYEGNELVYPNPVKDGLVLWYDFSGRTNDDAQRDVAEDLSGNGNHGTLQNFAYSEGSGYDKIGLSFDGVDDYVDVSQYGALESFTVSMTIETTSKNAYLFGASPNLFYLRKVGDDLSARANFGVFDMRTIVGSRFFRNRHKITEVSYILDHENKKFSIVGNGRILSSMDFDEPNVAVSIESLGSLKGFDQLLDGGLCSTKIYNRPLTAEEIAHNYAIEKERFGIE